MILFLLKRDDSVKMAMTGALIAPLVLLPGAAPGWSGSLNFLNVMAFMVLMSAVRFRLDQRTTRFEIALPIAGRQLLIVRTIGASLTVWAPAAAASLLLFLVRRTGSLQLLQGAAVLTLAALLPLTVRLRDAAIAGWLSATLFACAAATGAATWFLLPPVLHLTLFAALSAAMLLRACLAVPATFEVSPREAVESRPRRAEARPTKTHGAALVERASARLLGTWRQPAWWPILSSAMPWRAVSFFAGGVFVAGNSWLMLALSFTVFQAGIRCRDRTRWLHALPLSGRLLLGITLAATAAPYAAGVAFGTWIYELPFSPHVRPRLASYRPGLDPHDKFLYRTNVPPEFWQYAPTGRVPATHAPWGESAQPSSKSILGFTFYNPYTATGRNSPRFFDWQVGNATQAMYGRRMSWDQAEAIPYEATPGYPQENRVDVLTFAVLSFWLLFSVYLRELALSRWLGNTHFARYLAPAAIIPFAAWLGIELAVGLPKFGAMITGALLRILFTRLATALPQSPLALAAIAVVPSLVMYLLVEWQFARSETAGAILPSFRASGRGMEPQ